MLLLVLTLYVVALSLVAADSPGCEFTQIYFIGCFFKNLFNIVCNSKIVNFGFCRVLYRPWALQEVEEVAQEVRLVVWLEVEP